MVKKSDVLVAMPAYNEAKVIQSVIQSVFNQGYENILVVDDCSLDNTFKKASKTKAKVLQHVINRGAGAASATALEYARREEFKYVVFIDADGQHDPKEISKLLKKAQKYDVVIGSRMIGNLENMPVIRRIANFVGSVLTRVFFGLFVRDSQSGFKVFNRKAIESIHITFDRYEFCSEIIGEIYRNNLSFVEVPINVIYTDHSMGKGQSISNGFKMLLRFVFRK